MRHHKGVVMKSAFLLAACLVAAPAFSQSLYNNQRPSWSLNSGNPGFGQDQMVNGYTRSNGTYVEPYHRTAPDANPYNNYSTEGNYNPYTGQAGHKKPGY